MIFHFDQQMKINFVGEIELSENVQDQHVANLYTKKVMLHTFTKTTVHNLPSHYTTVGRYFYASITLDTVESLLKETKTLKDSTH